MRYLLVIGFIFWNTLSAADGSLRQEALRSGLQAVPQDFTTLLRVLRQDKEDVSTEKIELGRRLFFERRLSLDADISCASCHDLRHGGIDQEVTAIGHERQENPFHLNTPTVLNTALSRKLFWNGRSATLEDQAKGPIIASFEMASSPTLIESRLNDDESYLRAFKQAYERERVTFGQVVDAISVYERTLITRGRFDDYLEGDLSALDTEEKAGLRLFMQKGCVGCHNGMGLGGQELRKFPIMRHAIWSLADQKQINTLRERYDTLLDGLSSDALMFDDENDRYAYLIDQLGAADVRLLEQGYFDSIDSRERYAVMTSTGCYQCHEKGTYRVDKKTLAATAYPFENKGSFLGRGKRSRYFRVPLLRNIASTDPYFHNGGIEKLEDAIRLMVKHQSRTTITDQEVDRLVAFFKAVDGDLVEYGVQ